MEKDWKLVYVTSNLQKAELTKALLEESDIKTVIINKQDSSYTFGEIELYVKDSDFLRANHLVKSDNNDK